MRGQRPPRLAERLLSWILAPEDREPALGDLHEEYVSRADGGPVAAWAWYWGQLVRALAPSFRRRTGVAGVTPAGLGREVRTGARALIRRPALTLPSVATLALGIGMTTAIFSVVHAVLLRPLPYPGGDRLVQVWNTYPAWRGHEILHAYWDRIDLSWPEYLEWRDAQTSFGEVGIYGTTAVPLTGGGDPVEVLVGAASASLLPMLGAEPVLGRTFSAREQGPGASRVAVLSYELWRSRFGSDPRVVGDAVELDGRSYAVIGVLPQDFRLRPMNRRPAESHAVWIPVGALGEGLDRGNHNYEALGRLARGVDLEGARAETGRILAGELAPDRRGVRLALRKEVEVGTIREPLLLLLGASSLLVLMACANVAMLLLGETSRRRRELATRSALGASPGRIVRHLVVESTLLGLGGVIGGVLVAIAAASLLLRWAPENLPVPHGPVLDPVVLSFAVGLGLATGWLAGVVPALRARGRDVHDDLRARAQESVRRRGMQDVVLVGQIALSLVLLGSGGLLARTAAALAGVEPGFDAEGLVTARISLAEARYSREEATARFVQIVDALAGMAGTEGATLVSEMPFSGRNASSSFQIVGREVPEGEKQPEGNRRVVLPGYTEVLGIPLLAGRRLERSDRVFSAPVVLVSRSLADRYWPDGEVLGRRISRDRRTWKIVGVVEDVLHSDLTSTPEPTFYVPYEVAERRHAMTLVARSGLPRAVLVGRIRNAVWEVVPDAPVEAVSSAPALIARTTREKRLLALLLTTFAVAATLLSAVGLFGVTSRLVGARRRELGIRTALGATRWALVRSVVLEGVGPIVAGVAVGLLGVAVAGRMLSGFLFGVAPGDPLVIGGAALLLALTGIATSWSAAHRGTAIDPVLAIRSE